MALQIIHSSFSPALTLLACLQGDINEAARNLSSLPNLQEWGMRSNQVPHAAAAACRHVSRHAACQLGLPLLVLPRLAATAASRAGRGHCPCPCRAFFLLLRMDGGACNQRGRPQLICGHASHC